MMKKRSKILLSILVSIIIIGSLLFTYMWFAPYGRHEVSDTEPFITEEFLPKPDSIAVIRGGIAIKVSDDKRNQIYEAFRKAMLNCRDYGAWFATSDGRAHMRVASMMCTNLEFRYNRRMQFTGKIYTQKSNIPFKELEFDAFFLSISKTSNAIYMFTCYEGEYVRLGETSAGHLMFKKDDIKDFKKTIKEIL